MGASSAISSRQLSGMSAGKAGGLVNSALNSPVGTAGQEFYHQAIDIVGASGNRVNMPKSLDGAATLYVAGPDEDNRKKALDRSQQGAGAVPGNPLGAMPAREGAIPTTATEVIPGGGPLELGPGSAGALGAGGAPDALGILGAAETLPIIPL